MLPVLQPPSHARDLPPMSFSEANGIFFGPVPILWTIHVGRHHWISLADAYRSLPENNNLESDISEELSIWTEVPKLWKTEMHGEVQK